jgi:hypothetical protein
MATTRTAFGALMGTITTAASAVTNIIGQVDTTVGMAGTALDDAARRQQARSKLDARSYKRVIVSEKAMELETLQESILDWTNGDPTRAARFKATYDDLMSALD